MALQIKASKGMTSETAEMNRESVESSVNTTNNNISSNNNINAPKYGTVIPNRVFVGGISSATTETDLIQLFSNYGHVVGTKIIADRAGVSKGYGFVTFETEDEARRLQKDAENIVLRERRLNIAPAIRKQGFTRSTYEAAQTGATSPIPVPPNQLIRQNGVTFTYHNGMAFFPQQGMQPQATSPVTPIQNHVEPAPVYATGNPYNSMAQASTSPAFSFSYVPQGQIFYHAAHYPYHVPIDGCYPIEGHNGVMMPTQTSGESGGVMIPAQYYIAHPSPQPELSYYSPQSSPLAQINMPSQEAVGPPVVYASPRNYEPNSSPVVYSEQNGVESTTSITNLSTHSEEIESNRRNTSDKTMVSLLKTCNHRDRDNNNASSRGRIRGGGAGQFKGKKVLPAHPNDNNNDPDVHNKNSCAVTTTTLIRGRRSTAIQPYNNNFPNPQSFRPYFYENSRVSTSRVNPSQCPVQVPQFPYYPSTPRQFFASTYTSPSRRAFCPRGKYGGGGRGRTNNNKWYNRDSIMESGIEDGNLMPNTLTPPITPRSPQDKEVTQTEDVLNSMETLTI